MTTLIIGVAIGVAVGNNAIRKAIYNIFKKK